MSRAGPSGSLAGVYEYMALISPDVLYIYGWMDGRIADRRERVGGGGSTQLRVGNTTEYKDITHSTHAVHNKRNVVHSRQFQHFSFFLVLFLSFTID